MSEILRPPKMGVEIRKAPTFPDPQAPVTPAESKEPAEVDYASLISAARASLEQLNQRINAVEDVFRLRDDRNNWRDQAIAKEAEIERLQAQLKQAGLQDTGV